MSSNSEREAAREMVVAYHEEQLSELIKHVARAIDHFGNGEADVFEVDQVLFQYSRAAKELWKFCDTTTAEMAAQVAFERPSVDWWQRGAFRKR